MSVNVVWCYLDLDLIFYIGVDSKATHDAEVHKRIRGPLSRAVALSRILESAIARPLEHKLSFGRHIERNKFHS